MCGISCTVILGSMPIAINDIVVSGNKAIECDNTPKRRNHIHFLYLNFISLFVDCINHNLEDVIKMQKTCLANTGFCLNTDDDIVFNQAANTIPSLMQLRYAVSDEDFAESKKLSEADKDGMDLEEEAVNAAKSFISLEDWINSRLALSGHFISKSEWDWEGKLKEILKCVSEEKQADVFKMQEEAEQHVKNYLEQRRERIKQARAADNSFGQSGGCYIATCVYGSYDCPEVWALRRFRDYNLAGSWYGRLFVRFYYALSPTLVRLFGGKDWFRAMWKPFLDELVCKLKNKGYSSNPYKDDNL